MADLTLVSEVGLGRKKTNKGKVKFSKSKAEIRENQGRGKDRTVPMANTETDEVRELRREMEQLRVTLAAAVKESGATQTALPETRLVLPPPVKLPIYSGKEDPASWIERAKRTLSTQHLDGQDGVQFLKDYLQETAEDEIRHRDPQSPYDLFDILKSVFGRRASRPQQMREFYNRTQLATETITQYSHALVSMMEKMDLDSTESEERLKEQFVEGIRNQAVQRFLKRRTRDNRHLGFLELRQLALEECEESQTGKVHIKEVSAEQDSVKVDETPTWGRELIDLTKQMLKIHANMFQSQTQNGTKWPC
ncbi:uncharacterized protein LOC135481303 [Liolophura sinensis]|uniref:uncharacterized protein LOC135481303 n=1 Tax=Liolophura sinensis TaxID=3198878 RepID=UPI0031598410